MKSPFMRYSAFELSHLNKEHYEKLKDTYFGAGIWVLNLAKIRKDHLEEKMLAIMRDNTIIKRWPEQDVTNIACNNQVQFIPLNYVSYPYLHWCLKQKDFISHYSREELWDSIIHPKIIHYASLKPWVQEDCPLAQIWWQIFDYLKLPKSAIFKGLSKEKEYQQAQANFQEEIQKFKKRKKQFLLIFILYTGFILFLLIGFIAFSTLNE